MAGVKDLTEEYITGENLDEKLDGWMRETAPYRWRPVKPVKASRSALLVVDMTKAFVLEGCPLSSPNARVVLPRIRNVVDEFHDLARPVIWLVQGHHSVEHDRGKLLASWWPTPILEGTADVEMADGVGVGEGDKIIAKRRYSGFYQTDLELTLRCLGVEEVVICGVLTNVCPYSTAMEAFFRGFRVYYLADGTASLNERLHVNALCNIAGWSGYVVSSRDVLEWLTRG